MFAKLCLMLTDSLYQIPDNTFYMAPGPFEQILHSQDIIMLHVSASEHDNKNVSDFSQTKTNTKKAFYKHLIPESFNIFKEHQLQATHFDTYKKKADYSDWITLILAGSLFLITFMKVIYMKRFFDFFKTFFSYRYFNFLVRESNLFKEQISILLIINYFLVFSLFIYLSFRYFFNTPLFYQYSLIFYVKILLYLLIIVLIKNLFKVFIGIIYKTQLETYQYLHNSLVTEVMMGLLLFPVCVFIVFQPSFYVYIVGFAIIGLLSIYKLMRLMIIGKVHGKFSVFYLFIYLCTIEILPMFIIVKLIMNYLQIG